MKMTNTIKIQVVRFGEYMVGGGGQFWTGYTAFSLFDKGFGWTFWIAKSVSYLIGASFNFAIERFWVFGSKRAKKEASTSAKKYYVLMFANFLIDLGLVWGLKGVGISPYIGQFISAGLFTVTNYLLFSKWVFKKVDGRR